jgi:hypothetical protein
MTPYEKIIKMKQEIDKLKQPRPIHGWFCDGFMWQTDLVWAIEPGDPTIFPPSHEEEEC